MPQEPDPLQVRGRVLRVRGIILALAGMIMLRGLDLPAEGSKGGIISPIPGSAKAASSTAPKPPAVENVGSLYLPGEDLQQAYIAAYLKIGEAQDLEKQGDTATALIDDKLALHTLIDIQKANPNWELDMVGQRIVECQAAVARLTGGHGASLAARTPSKSSLYSSKSSLEQSYLQAYLKLSEAVQADKRGDARTALADYQLTLNTLLDIQNADPDWETALVVHRIADCRAAIQNLD